MHAETPTTSNTSSSEAANNKEVKVNSIVIESNDIFDLDDPNTFFIHRWANKLHINTRDYVIRNHLSFTENDSVDQKDLDEAQRILRAEPYIRDAKISFIPNKAGSDHQGEKVRVETWDNWSLLPTFSASRNGGESQFSAGIKEDNLLGLGISTRFKYQSSTDRTGYKFAATTPVNIIKHATFSVDFYDNSDGQATHLYFVKPFYTLEAPHMYSAEYLDDNRVDTLKQNGQERTEFIHDVTYNNARFGWLLNNNGDTITRIITGLTQDRHRFSHVPQYPNATLPQNRDFLYPWLAYQYLQDDFKVLKNIYLINDNEDFNLGWQHYIKLGLETRDLDNTKVGYHLNWQTRRGFQAHDHLLLLNMAGEGVFSTRQKDYFQVNVAAEYFYRIDPKWTAYSKLRLSTSQNNYLDKPLTLGDNNGIRGYPNSYQYGDNQWTFTAEIRNYPNINLYQLAELGWAVFADVGQASGGNTAYNETNSVIGSVGAGLRLYSSKSSYGNVAHIDLSVPFTTGEAVNSWEWRFLVRNRF